MITDRSGQRRSVCKLWDCFGRCERPQCGNSGHCRRRGGRL